MNNEKEKADKDRLNSIREVLGLQLEAVKEVVVNLAKMKLDDNVTVLEAESFEAGKNVNIKTEDGQLIALPVGEYTMEDGQVLVVKEEGIIDSIGEKVEEEATEEEVEVAATDEPVAKTVPKKIVEAVTKESYFSKDEMIQAMSEVIDSKLESFKAEFSKVEPTEEKVETLVHNPEKVELSKQAKGSNRLMDFINSTVK